MVKHSLKLIANWLNHHLITQYGAVMINQTQSCRWGGPPSGWGVGGLICPRFQNLQTMLDGIDSKF